MESVIIYTVVASAMAMREWRNWQTRTFEGRVVYTVRVQVPFSAPNKKAESILLDRLCFFLLSGVDAQSAYVFSREGTPIDAQPPLHCSGKCDRMKCFFRQ